jgi:hypothetical protein
LLTHPVEGLVIESALVDAATVPIDGAAAGAAVVVSMVIALLVARAVASPGVCTGRTEADAEKSCNADSGRQCRCRHGTLESHFLTPFLVDVAVLATCGVTLGRGHGYALWWQCARAVQAVTDPQPFAINEIEDAGDSRHGHCPLFTHPAAALAFKVGDAKAVARIVAGGAAVAVPPMLIAVGLTDIVGTLGDT